MNKGTNQESLNPILVSVDFSSYSRAALVFACDLARRFHAPLFILHVVHETVGPDGTYQMRDDLDRVRPKKELAQRLLGEFVDEIRDNHPGTEALDSARLRLVEGLPAERICEVATHIQASMIIVGSHGRTGLPRVIQGSVAQRVAKKCRIPVTIIKEEQGNDCPNWKDALASWNLANLSLGGRGSKAGQVSAAAS